MDRKDSRLPVEVTAENMPMALGMMAAFLEDLRGDLNAFIRTHGECEEENKAAHERIEGRLKEHDDYLFVLRISSCFWKSLTNKNALRILAIAVGALGLDFAARWLSVLMGGS